MEWKNNQNYTYKDDDYWSINKVIEYVNEGKEGIGIVQHPIQTNIPIENQVAPLLHLLLGLGNDIID